MLSPYEGLVVGRGTRIQAGIPMRPINADRATYGLLVRGVVVSTYVSDEKGHPQEGLEETIDRPLAVYCDVLVYPSIPGQRMFALRNVVVSQDVGGMHRGRIWKPRAVSVNTTGNPIDQVANPAHLDGDHVLICFLNNNFDQPVILKSLPHPLLDTRHESEMDKSMKLVHGDGDPDFFRHHGVHYGVDNLGNFELDTTWANNGELDAFGREADPPKTGDAAPETFGNQVFNLPMESKFEIVLWDMSPVLNVPPDLPEEKMRLIFNKSKLHVKVTEGETLTLEEDGVDAKIILGDGAVKVAVADHLETLYGALKTWLQAHTHSTGTGPSGVPLNNPAPDWDSDINSSQLLIPDTQ